MAPPRHPLRSYVVTLFRRGELISVQEATLICDASRQAITKWLKVEGISISAHRLAFIARKRTAAQRLLDGKGPVLRPSKSQMRLDAEEAIERFNAAQGGS